jgi:hypothetical protein
VITAADVVNAAGSSLLQVAVPGAPRPVLDIGFSEPDDPAVTQPGDLVLGVGVSTVDEAVDLVVRAAAAEAAGVVLKAPLVSDPAVARAAERHGVALVELQRSVSWAHVVWLLRGVIDRAAAPGSPAAGDASVHGDLFALADAAAAIVDAPVTIEDARSRVLAYSSRQDRTDRARVSTIVGRRVPEEVVSHFRARGVFRRLARSDEPIFVAAGPNGILPRLIVPVRAGGEWLGSIWAVVDEPVAPDRVAGLASAAGVLALHLLRLRAQADLSRRVSREQLRTVLRRFTPAQRTGSELPQGPWRVVSLAGMDDTGDVRQQMNLWESVARRRSWRDPLIADLDDMPFALVTEPSTAGPPKPGSWPWLQQLVVEVRLEDATVRAGAGSVVHTLADLPRSRVEAAEIRHLMDLGELPAATNAFEERWDSVVIHRGTSALPAPTDLGGPLPTLLEHDAAHGTDYARTLAAYLSHPNEPQRAAAVLHVHVNSLRYRMRRINEVAAIDLGSPRTRLALQLQLAALPAASSSTAP